MTPASSMPEAERWRLWGAMAILAIGSLAMVGDLFGWRVIKGVGLASGIAPLPKVFSDVDGFETFAADFTLLIETADGSVVEKPVTPAVYSGLAGPYNRRNVYGATLSYAPRLPEALWRAPFCHGLRPGGRLRDELGIPADATAVRVLIETRTAGRRERWILEDPCTSGS